MAEAGVPGIEVDGFMGVIGPKGLPPSVITRLESELVAMTKVADFQERLKAQGLVPVGSTGKEFRAVVERDLPIWKGVANAANIKLD